MRPACWLIALLVALPAGAGVLTGRAGQYTLEADITPDPPLVGPVTVSLAVTSGGQPVTGATVTITPRLRGAADSAPRVNARDAGDGHYHATIDLPERGVWLLAVAVNGAVREFRITTGNPIHQRSPAAVRQVVILAVLTVVLPLLVGLAPARLVPPRRRTFVAGALLLVLALFLARAVTRTFRRPGQMDVIEAQAMDMTIMKPPVGVVPVAVETVEPRDFSAAVSYTGSVVPDTEQDVRARVTGRIVDMPIYPGDAVRRGQIVARLDTAELSGKASEALLMHLAAQEAAGAARADATGARAAVDEAAAMLRAAEHRVEQAERDVAARAAAVTRAESMVDTARAAVTQSESQLAAARAARRTSAAQSDEGREAVRAAEAERDAASSRVTQAEEAAIAAERGQAEARRMLAAANAGRDRATANLTAAEAELPQAEADVAAAQAEVDYQVAELRRMTALLADGAVSQQEFDAARSEHDKAQADLRRTRAAVDSVRGRIAAGRAEVAEAEESAGAAGERLAAAEAMARSAQAMIAEAGSALTSQEAGIGRGQAEVRSRLAGEDEAESMIAMRSAEVTRMAAEVRSAEAELEAVREELAGSRAMQRQAGAERDRAKSALTAAREAARAGSSRAAEAAEMAAGRRAAAFTAETIAGYTVLRAELDGVVTERVTSPSTLVQPGDVLVRIAAIDRVRLQANVAAADAGQVRLGAAVRIIPQKDAERAEWAAVTSVFPATDPTSRTTIVETLIDNPDRFYLPGDFITLQIGVGAAEEQVITVPAAAVVHVAEQAGDIYGETSPAVWTVRGGGGGGKTEYYCTMHPEVVQDEPGKCPKCDMDLTPRQVAGGEATTEYYCTMHPEVVQDQPGKCPKCDMDLTPRQSGGAGTAHRVRVALGRRDGERVVVTRGLSPGDQVIYRGHEHLREGDRVQPSDQAVDVPQVGDATHQPGAAAESGGGHAGH